MNRARALSTLAFIKVALWSPDVLALNCEDFPISYRVSSGDAEGVRACLDDGYPADEPTEGKTALFTAVKNKRADIARLLVGRGARVNHVEKVTGMTPLMEAAQAGDPTCVQLLIERDAAIEAKDVSGRTALHYAAIAGSVAAIDRLVQAGANREAQYHYHENLSGTPLIAASFAGHEGAVRRLAESGANVNAHSRTCLSALYWAAAQGRGDLVDVLVGRGAFGNVIGTSSAGEPMTPFQAAVRNGHPEIDLKIRSTAVMANEQNKPSGCNIVPLEAELLSFIIFVDAARPTQRIEEISAAGRFRLRAHVGEGKPVPTDVMLSVMGVSATRRRPVAMSPSTPSGFYISDPINVADLPASTGDMLRATMLDRAESIKVMAPHLELIALGEGASPATMVADLAKTRAVTAHPGDYLLTVRVGPRDLQLSVSEKAGGPTLLTVGTDRQQFRHEDRDYVRIPIKLTGEGTSEVTVSAPGAASQSFLLRSTAYDLDIEQVPEYAEDREGGLVERGKTIELQLTTPNREERLEIATRQAAVRFFRDREKRQPFVPNGVPPAPRIIGDGSRIVWEDARAAPRSIYVELRWEDGTAPENVLLKLYSGDPNPSRGMQQDVVLLRPVELGLNVQLPKDASGTRYAGVNGDDDNQNEVRDFEDRMAPVVAENDLFAIEVTQRGSDFMATEEAPPFVPGLDAVASPGISIWKDPSKGAGAALIVDDLRGNGSRRGRVDDRGTTVRLHGEAVVPGVGKTIAVEKAPQDVQLGVTVPLGKPIRAEVPVTNVQVDVDIDNVPDERNAELTQGGVVRVVDSGRKAPKESLMGRLILRLRPDELKQPGANRGAKVVVRVINGADKIRLWHGTPNGKLKALELREGSADLAPSDLPNVFVQGMATSAQREVEIDVSYVMPQSAGGTDAKVIVHHDTVTFTVVEEELDRRAVRLQPELIVIPQKDLSGTVPLQVFLDTQTTSNVRIETESETKYRWIAAPGVDSIPNPFGEGEIPLARITVQHGRLQVLSPGVQLLQASYKGIDSNVALIFAGLELKEIDIEPESTISTPLSIFAGNPWAILASARAGNFLTRTGYLHVGDVTFSVTALNQDVSLSTLRKALDKRPFDKLLGARAKAVLAVLGPIAGYAANQALVTYESQNPAIVDSYGIPGSNGFVQGLLPGITAITGTLDLGPLGSAEDTVMTVVLPVVETLSVARREDPLGKHHSPIIIAASAAATPGIAVSARAEAMLTEESKVTYKGNALSAAVTRIATGPFDQEIRVPGTDIAVRLRGEIKNTPKAGNQSELAFSRMRIDFPAIRATVMSHQRAIADVVPDEPSAGEQQYVRRGSAPNGDPAFLQVREVSDGGFLVTEDARRPRREVVVEPVAAHCQPLAPVFHMGGQSVAALDRAFTNAPFRAALNASRHPLARILTGAGASTGRVSSEPFSTTGPWSAGWLYFIEYPVKDASKCELVLVESATQTDGSGQDLRNKPARIETLAEGTGYVVGRKSGSREGSIIFAGIHGWTDLTGRTFAVERMVRRLSIVDSGGTKSPRRTALLVLQQSLDARKTTDERPKFARDLIGAAEGEVGSGFNPRAELDAMSRFRGIGLPDS